MRRLALLLFACVCTAAAGASDWPRFRGPNGSGISQDAAAPPTEWNDSKNLKWKVVLPGPGSSSPIVVNDRVFITCWSGYAAPGGSNSVRDLKRHLICLDRRNGSVLWKSTVPAVQPEPEYRGMFAEHGYASHTPASDGERVYAFFGKSGLYAYDLDGNELWNKPVGTADDRRGWGTASSPILYENLVIVPALVESHSLIAFDKLTGEQVWKEEARGFGSCWGTPVLVEVSDERTDLVIAVPYEIWGLDPATGRLRWHCQAMNTDSFCSSVVAHAGVIYAVEGRSGGAIAVRAGGEGDVTDTHVVWSANHRGRIGTPVYFGGKLYVVNGGVIIVVDAQTGERLSQSRLDRPSAEGTSSPRARSGRSRMGGSDYSSPIVVDGKLYYVARSGVTSVVSVGNEIEQLGTNLIPGDDSDFNATPAASDGDLFVRSNVALYCLSNEQ